jgi:hypothetical protein
MKAGISVAACVCVLGFAGCGGDDDPPTTTTTSSTTPSEEAGVAPQPEPATPIADVLPEINAALASGDDCEAWIALAHAQTRQEGDPEAPPTKEECASAEPLLADLEGMEFTESEEFGTGAIIQGEATEALAKVPDEVVTMSWILDNGEWAHQQSIFIGDPQIGEEPAGDALPVAQEFVDAVRNEDCDAMEPILDPNGQLAFGAQGDVAKACKMLLGGALFAPSVADTPEIELADFGGTLDHTYVGVPTANGYFTIELSTPEVKPGEETQETEMLVSDVRANEFDIEDVKEG